MRFELIHYQTVMGCRWQRLSEPLPGLMESWWETLITQIRTAEEGNRLPEAGLPAHLLEPLRDLVQLEMRPEVEIVAEDLSRCRLSSAICTCLDSSSSMVWGCPSTADLS